MKLGKLGLAASAVVVMALATAAGLHVARAQNFDDEGGRDRTWATKGQSADAKESNDVSATSQNAAADSKGSNAVNRSWKGSESMTGPQYSRQSHSLTRATAGTGVKTGIWTSNADAKTVTTEGTVVKTDTGWTHQGTWTGPTGTTADHSADVQSNASGGVTNTVTAPNGQTGSGTATPVNPAPSLASPSE